jgi:hypothetical protein
MDFQGTCLLRHFVFSPGYTGSHQKLKQRGDRDLTSSEEIYLDIKVFEMAISAHPPFLISLGNQKGQIGAVSRSQ